MQDPDSVPRAEQRESLFSDYRSGQRNILAGMSASGIACVQLGGYHLCSRETGLGYILKTKMDLKKVAKSCINFSSPQESDPLQSLKNLLLFGKGATIIMRRRLQYLGQRGQENMPASERTVIFIQNFLGQGSSLVFIGVFCVAYLKLI